MQSGVFKTTGGSRSGVFQADGFQRGWIHAWSNLNIKRVHCIKGAQLGASECLRGFKSYELTQRKRRVGYWLPREDDVTKYSATKQKALFENNPVIASYLLASNYRKKGPDNNAHLRAYQGNALEYLLAANSAANFVDITVDTAINDELDRQPEDVEGEGSPDANAFGRTAGVYARKNITVSSPGAANRETGFTNITRCIAASDIVVYRQLKCPSEQCAEWFFPEWGSEKKKGGIKFLRKKFADGKLDINETAATAHHECPHCGNKITHDDLEDLDNYYGEWRNDTVRMDEESGEFYEIATGLVIDDPVELGMVINGLFSRTVTWEDGVRQFLKAKEELEERFNPLPMIQWVNEYKAEVYRPPDTSEIISWKILQSRAEDYFDIYGAACPQEVQYITAAIDLHEGGDITEPFVAAEIMGWGYGFESWSLDYIYEEGDCLTTDVVDRVCKTIIEKLYMQPNGDHLQVSVCAIDSGWQPTIAYNYQKKNETFWIPIKGENQYGKPIATGLPKKPNDAGARVVRIGTDTAKDQIYAGFKNIHEPGAGYAHFPSRHHMPGKQWYDPAYFKGQVSETVRNVDGKMVYKPRSTHIRNEPLDLRVYNIAMMRFMLIQFGATLVDYSLVDPSRITVRQVAKCDLKLNESETTGQGPNKALSPALDLTPKGIRPMDIGAMNNVGIGSAARAATAISKPASRFKRR